MTRRDFIGQVRQRVGASLHDDLEPWVNGVLHALAERFGDEGRTALEAALEHAGVAAMAPDRRAAKATGAPLGARVCELTGLSAARARELTQAVCYVLTEGASADTEALLVARAPNALRPMFIRTEAPAPDSDFVTHRAGGLGTTLATGRPGSRHPLSEARPPSNLYPYASSIADEADDVVDDTDSPSDHDASPHRESVTVAIERPLSPPLSEDGALERRFRASGR